MRIDVLYNISKIPCLFVLIYHTTMCSLMLATCSHKGFPKIHPDAPRNACGVWTIARRVYRVLTRQSPTQLIIQNNDHVLSMSHVSYDIII
jgi:hypothetical protein